MRMNALPRVIPAVLLLLTAPVPADRLAPGCPDPATWNALLAAQRTRYPAMQVDDAYKLVHQSTMGSEHAIPSRDMAAAWMTREVGGLQAGPPEPMVDTLAGGRFVRVNLRPYLAAGGSPDRLLEAFIATANQSARDTTSLHCALMALQAQVDKGAVPWNRDSVRTFIAARVSEGIRPSITATRTKLPIIPPIGLCR